MENYLDNGNYPPGHEDLGIKIRYSGSASGYNSEKKFHDSLKAYPSDTRQADQWINTLRRFGDVINERALERIRREGLL